MTYARTIAHRDQIATMLQQSSIAMATQEIADNLPPMDTVVAYCRAPGAHRRGPLAKTPHMAETCCGDHHHITRRPTGQEAYTLLLAMMRSGDVERLKFSGLKSAYWKWSGPVPDQDEVDALEAMFAAPEAER